MAPSSAAAPESLTAPPAEAAVEQMLQAGTQDGVRQAVEARSLTPAAAETNEARLRSWNTASTRGRAGVGSRCEDGRDSGADDAAAEEATQPGPVATADSADGPAGRLRSAEQR